MSVERDFAIGFGGRLVAIEAVLYRLVAQMPDGRGFLDQVEVTLDRAHAEHLSDVLPENRALFLEVLKEASAAIGKMRDQIR
ncbi:MAG: hypothetical protein ACRYGP_16845 [Janthinobacterium lividum]